MSSRYMRWLAVFAALMLAAAACGGSDSSDDSAGGDTEASSDSSGSDSDDSGDSSGSDDSSSDSGSDDSGSDDSAMADGEGKGGTLVIASTQVPRHLNGTVQSGLATAVPGTQLNASPLLYDDAYNPKPYLAESWEVADDGLSVTLNLVKNAVFHDGQPITSADVAFSIETAKANHPFKPMFAPVESVDTPDDHTTVINLSQPHPALLLAMSPALLPVIPKHIFDDGQEMKEHPRNTEDFVGSGPFKLTEYEAGSIIRMEKFEDFFIEGKPLLDGIIMQITPDQASIALGLENGDVDFSATLAPADIVRLRDSDSLTVTSDGHEGLGQVQWLEFNVNDPVVSDVKVRQAVAYAIDNAFLSDVIDQGLSVPSTTGIVGSSPYFSSSAEAYDQDVDKAKALLAEAGYAEGELTLTIDYIPPNPAQAEYIVQALEDVGINGALNVSPDFPTWAGRVAGGEHQMTLNQVWNWGDPVIGVHRTYLTENQVGAIWTNNTGYSNAEVDALLVKAGQELDQGSRASLYGEFQEIVNDEAPIVFLNNPKLWNVFSSRVQNPPTDNIWGTMSPMLNVWIDE